MYPVHQKAIPHPPDSTTLVIIHFHVILFSILGILLLTIVWSRDQDPIVLMFSIHDLRKCVTRIFSLVAALVFLKSIKSENQLILFLDYSCKKCTDTSISTGSYIVFYLGGLIDHFTHVPGPNSHSSAKIEYNEACTALIDWAHYVIINH